MEEMSYSQIEGTLYNYKLIKASIENNKLKLDNLELEDGTTAIVYGEPSSKTNKFNSITENAALKNIERKERLKKRIAIDTNTIQMIDNALNALTELERTIIEMFYIENMEWWKVAAKVHYSEGWCKAKRNEAINKMLFTINGKQPLETKNERKLDE